VSGLKDVAAAYSDKQFKGAVARTKFRNVKTEVDGILFHSKFEAHRWQELKAEAAAGLIRNLERQRPFAIVVNDIHVCNYISDFVYERACDKAFGMTPWMKVVEDAKGMKTDMYRLKAKLMKACLGIEILETRAKRK
jgi:hypothetical protein